MLQITKTIDWLIVKCTSEWVNTVMPISEDSRAALALLKEVQQSVRDTEDLKNNPQVRKIP